MPPDLEPLDPDSEESYQAEAEFIKQIFGESNPVCDPSLVLLPFFDDDIPNEGLGTI